MSMEIKSFGIEQADCFLIKIEESGKHFNLLVDCGKEGLLNKIKEELNGETLNGVVITHIDADHIRGAIDLMEKGEESIIRNKTFFLYNKYDESLISYEQGQKLFELIKQHNREKLLIKSYASNYFRENEVLRRRCKGSELPVWLLSKKQRALIDRCSLEKNVVYITILSPDIITLKKFMRSWNENKKNSSLQNKSSIVFLLEFNDRSILMLGDGMVTYVERELENIKGLTHIDYIKISHHGALNNNKGLVNIINKYKCEHAVVTIKGNQNNEKKHPSRELIKELEAAGCYLYTSTEYECDDNDDEIKYIVVKDKLVV